MKTTVLGRNGPFPAPGGATSGYLVTAGDTRVQLDLGAGTLARLTARAAPEDLTALVLTHWHYDHCSDVLPLLFRLEAMGKRPLPVYGPVDETSLVRQAVTRCRAAELHDLIPGDEVELGDVRLTVFEARHPVPAVMLRLTDGHSTLCYTGDTNTVPWLTDFARDADLLLADGLFPTRLWNEKLPHLSSALAAQAAKDAGVKRLVITHLHPELDPETLLSEARAAYPGAELAQEGKTY